MRIFSKSYVLPSASTRLSKMELAQAGKICDWAAHLINLRENYIDQNSLDRAINHPAANWDTGSDIFTGYNAIATKKPDCLSMLRFFTQTFSGWQLGLAPGKGIPHTIPKNFDSYVLDLIKKSYLKNAWWLSRYRRLIALYPELSCLSFPIAFGESGLRNDDGVLNHDTFVYLERIGLLKTAGVLNEINNRQRATILEIGSGFGALAYMMRQLVPKSTYICVDIPESLIFAALYLSRFNSKVCFVDENTDLSTLTSYDFVFIPNYMFHRLVESGLHVDLAINTLSMSEMLESQVNYYCEGLTRLLGKTGVFFEQNQNNTELGFCFAKEIVARIFNDSRDIKLPMMDLTQGTATLWSNFLFKDKQRPR